MSNFEPPAGRTPQTSNWSMTTNLVLMTILSPTATIAPQQTEHPLPVPTIHLKAAVLASAYPPQLSLIGHLMLSNSTQKSGPKLYHTCDGKAGTNHQMLQFQFHPLAPPILLKIGHWDPPVHLNFLDLRHLLQRILLYPLTKRIPTLGTTIKLPLQSLESRSRGKAMKSPRKHLKKCFRIQASCLFSLISF